MKFDAKLAAVLAVLWITTCATAFWIGGRRVAANHANSTDNPAHSGTANGGGAAGITGLESAGSASGAVFDATGRANRVRNLVAMARNLGENELERRLPDLVADMDANEVREALGMLAELRPGPSRRRAELSLIERWAQIDPKAAFTHIDGVSEPKTRHDMKRGAMRSWASIDPAAALEYARENDHLPGVSMSAVFEGIGESKDLTTALGFISSLDPTKDMPRGWSVYGSVRELFDKDDRAVIKWAETLPEGKTRDSAIHALIDQWARYDPLAAKQWLETNAGDSNVREGMVELGESWARVDPQSAVAWANSLPEGDNNARVYERIFRRWLQYDYENAANYLATQEPSPQLDRAFEQYISRAKYTDPDATMAWAESITDDKRRFSAIASVARVWRDRDRGALESYVNSSALSDSQKRYLLR